MGPPPKGPTGGGTPRRPDAPPSRRPPARAPAADRPPGAAYLPTRPHGHGPPPPGERIPHGSTAQPATHSALKHRLHEPCPDMPHRGDPIHLDGPPDPPHSLQPGESDGPPDAHRRPSQPPPTAPTTAPDATPHHRRPQTPTDARHGPPRHPTHQRHPPQPNAPQTARPSAHEERPQRSTRTPRRCFHRRDAR